MENLTIKSLVENLGGLNNIKDYEGCSTRITFDLINPDLVNYKVLKNYKDIISIILYNNEINIVLGEKTQDFLETLNFEWKNKIVEKEKKENLSSRFLGVLAGIFAPALTILAATGMIKGFLSLFVALNLISINSGAYTILYAIGDSFFYFMPVFLGASAAKYFKCDRFLGIVVGAVLVYPTITALADQEAVTTIFTGTLFESSVYTDFFGLPVILPAGGYVSTVIPVILAVYFATLVWKFWNRIIPNVLSGFLTPTLTLLIVLPLTFLVVGPIAMILSNMLGALAALLYRLSPALEGAFIGGFWQLLVMFGLHWALIPIMMLNLNQSGFDSFLQAFAPACFAQAAACLAIFLKTKNKELKELCIPAFISGIFGITEPALYGVTLPRTKVFIGTCIASAIGGALVGILNVKTYMFGGMGIFSFPSYINPNNGDLSSMFNLLWASIANFVISFFLTLVLFKNNSKST